MNVYFKLSDPWVSSEKSGIAGRYYTTFRRFFSFSLLFFSLSVRGTQVRCLGGRHLGEKYCVRKKLTNTHFNGNNILRAPEFNISGRSVCPAVNILAVERLVRLGLNLAAVLNGVVGCRTILIGFGQKWTTRNDNCLIAYC